ncbi:MAG: 4Fe-4S dicluster domain-containing protein [Puniceicoccaceae bacterium]
MSTENHADCQTVNRREVIKTLFTLAAAYTATGCKREADSLSTFFHTHFQEMSPEKLASTLEGWERRYKKRYNRDVAVNATPAQEGVLFGYALDVSRCIGCRKCVYACVEENNQSRDPQVHWITVLEMDNKHGIDLRHADAYYDAEKVPREDKFYFPVQCQQCENPACVKSCPVKATWKDSDGIVVVDYEWCVGCRCCVTACPYGARSFNWARPNVPAEEINPVTEYLGNRPRPQGVVEKCTFCMQRSRNGKYPACVEVCPVGARKFGNLLDPESEINYVLKNHRIFILKEELNTQPKFFYYFSI